MSEEREKAIAALTRDGTRTRAQAEAFLDLLGSGLRRRGWIEGEPLSDTEVDERFNTFMGGDEA